MLEDIAFRDVAPLLLTVGITMAVPLLPISRRSYVIAFLSALAGVVAPIALTFGAQGLLGPFRSGTTMLLVFWAPVFAAPAVVALAWSLRDRPISSRGLVSSVAFASVYAADLFSHFVRTGGPARASGALGVAFIIGWMLAPAAIIAIVYTVVARNDEPGEQPRTTDPEGR